jgi:excisionase family DNA binding protein
LRILLGMATEAPIELMRVADVAAALNVSVGLVYQAIDSGDLPAVRVGRRALRVDRADLADYLLRRNGDEAA